MSQSTAKLERVSIAIIETSFVEGRLNLAQIAKRAGVSRSYLYQNSDAVDLVRAANARIGERFESELERKELGWRATAENALAEIRELKKEISSLRTQLSAAHSSRDSVASEHFGELFRLRSELCVADDEARMLKAAIDTSNEKLASSRQVVGNLTRILAEREAELLAYKVGRED